MSKEIKIGSHVAVLNDNIQGSVIKIQGDEVLIVDSEGFEWQYKSNELVLYGKQNVLDSVDSFTSLNIEQISEKLINTHLKKGVRVSSINCDLKGVIKERNNNSILVQDEFGFENECYASELVAYDNSLKQDQSIIEKPTPVPHKKSAKLKMKSTATIVDLHNNNPYLDKSDILQNQLQIFQEELEIALQKKQEQIIFIHGKGQGILRDAILSILDEKKLKHKKAPYRQFGQGALVVFLSP